MDTMPIILSVNNLETESVFVVGKWEDKSQHVITVIQDLVQLNKQTLLTVFIIPVQLFKGV